MTRHREALVITAGLTGVVALLCASSLWLQATAAAVPLAVAGPTLLLLLTQLVTDARRSSSASPADASDLRPAGGLARREVSTIAWLIGLLAMTWAFGLLVALPAYLLLHLRARSGERWLTSIVAAGAAWWVLYVVLGLLLDMKLRPGVIWLWLTPS